MKAQFEICLLLSVLLPAVSACGGGGGGGSASAQPSSEAASPAPAPLSGTAAVPVGAAMSWRTDQSPVIRFLVKDGNGGAVAGAAVRLFTYTTVDPQAASRSADAPGQASDPVPLAAIETLVTDAAGRATWEGRVAGHHSGVLVVVTSGAASARQVVPLASGEVSIGL